MSARTKPLTVKEPTETDVKVSAVSLMLLGKSSSKTSFCG